MITDAFIIILDVLQFDNDSDTFAEIPIVGVNNNYDIDWGDNNIETNQTGKATHLYSNYGTYEVKITGIIDHINYGDSNLISENKKQQLKSIKQWGNIQWKSFGSAFSGCRNLSLEATDNPNLSEVTDMSFMFYNTNLGGYSTEDEVVVLSIENWNVSNVENMSYMFAGEPPFENTFNKNIGNWNVSNVTNMDYMFFGSFFNQNIGNWDVSNVISFEEIFSLGYLSTSNYDALLVGWSQLQLKENIRFSAQSFYCNSENERASIINNFNWNISDNGKDPSCNSQQNTACEAHIAFIIDESGSIDSTESSEIRIGLNSFIDSQLNSPFVISLIGMSDSDTNDRNDHVLEQNVTSSSLPTLKNWIDNFRNRGIDISSDYWASGLEVIQNLNESPDIIIIISDGLQTNNPQSLKDKFNSLSNISNIFTIGISPGFYDIGTSTTSRTLEETLTYYLGRTPIESSNSNDLLDSDYKSSENFTGLKDILIDLSEALVSSGVGCGNINLIGSSVGITSVSLNTTFVNQLIGTVIIKNDKINDHTIAANTIIASINGLDFIILSSTTINKGTQLEIAVIVNGSPEIVGDFSETISIPFVLNPNDLSISFTINEDLEVNENFELQSPYIYIQAAGSTGNNGNTNGIYLRWLLKGFLGDVHLPKGDYTDSNYLFNKPDDFIKIHKAPYSRVFVTLDFEQNKPTVTNENKYFWIYKIEEKTFYVYFKNTTKYDEVRSSINPLEDSWEFITQYGNEVIEVEAKKYLFFATKLFTNNINATIQAETLSVEFNTATAQKYITSRNETTENLELKEENIRCVRFKTDSIIKIEFEFYSDVFNYHKENNSWQLIEKYALTTNSEVALNRLEPEDGSANINGLWPRFNDGETVNVDNYKDRWNGEETLSYGSNYYEYYDRRLETTVKRYLELSVNESDSNPTASENIFYNVSADLDNEELDSQRISNLSVIQLAAMDFHTARMLGLGHIDKEIDTNQPEGKFIYLSEYTTFKNPDNGQLLDEQEGLQHLYLTVPTSTADERLPQPVNLIEPSFGTNNSNDNRNIDENGYLFNGKERYISLFCEDIEDNEINNNFFSDNSEFSTLEGTAPVYVGIEYKLFEQTDPNESSWVKPELSNTDRYKNFSTNSNLVTNETLPILLPEPNELLFLHKEREEGWHRYSSYGIDWFSRSQRSNVFWDINTEFQAKNRLVPPSNIKAHFIVEESPLVFSSAYEQDLLKQITDEDKTLIRLTFDHHSDQDIINYQINEKNLGSFADPLNKDAIFKDENEVFAEKVNLFFRTNVPRSISGKIKDITSHSDNSLVTVTTTSYNLISTDSEIVPEIAPDFLNNFIGSILFFNNKKYVIYKVETSNIINEGPIFTIYKELVSNSILTGNKLDATIPLTIPDYNEDTIFNTVENMLSEENWKVNESDIINKLDFQIDLGYNNLNNIKREVIEDVDIDGNINEVLEKSRGIWDNATIEEINSLQNKNSITESDSPTGVYKVVFNNSLDNHSQFDETFPISSGYSVNWYKGIIRVHTLNNPNGERKILEVAAIENIGTNEPLTLYAIDPQLSKNTTDSSTPENFDPILTGLQNVNFYPGYRVYVTKITSKYITEEYLLPNLGENINYSIFGLQSIDGDQPKNRTDLNDIYKSKISEPSVFFVQEKTSVEVPLIVQEKKFLYSTRPDSFGKSTFTLTPGFSHIPHGILFYRGNDDIILNVLYNTETVLKIKSDLLNNEDISLVNTWQNFFKFYIEYTKENNPDNYFVYPEEDMSYTFPLPNKYELYNSINNVLEFRNENYGTNYNLLNLGDLGDEANNGIIGTIPFSEIVIPSLDSQGIPDSISFKEYIITAISNVFTPLTEIPLIYEYIKDSDYQPTDKKQNIRDTNGNLLLPTDSKFDIAPMAKRMSQTFVDEIPEAETRILFSDFNIDGTSNNLYFYSIREINNRMQLGDISKIIGPVKTVNTKPPTSPDVRRLLPVLENSNLGINAKILIEINSYQKTQNIKKINLYRTLDVTKSSSVRYMDLIATIDLVIDNQLENSVWKIEDNFEDLEFIPYGDALYYRVSTLREIKYMENENTIIDHVPSIQSKLLVSSILENNNPESPSLVYSFDENNSNDSILIDVVLKWNKITHNAKYYLYKINLNGNWVKIDEISTNEESIEIELSNTDLTSSDLEIKDEDGNSIYHHFKVLTENSSGLLSLEEKILTIGNNN